MSERSINSSNAEQKCRGVWYSEAPIEEVVALGDLLSLDDFKQALETTNQQLAQAKSVFRSLLDFMARNEGDEVLAEVWDHIDIYRANLDRTHLLYIETQCVHDLIGFVEDGGDIPGIGLKGLQLMRAVVYDEEPAELLKGTDRLPYEL